MMPPMKTLYVGCAVQTGPQRKYWKHFGALEVEARIVETMKASTAARWRAEAPPHASFVPVVPPALAAAHFAGDALAVWKRTLAISDALGAHTVLLHTPSSFRPTRDNRERLVDFIGSHRPEGLTVAWWAEGLWESQPEDRDAVCAAAGIVPAVDPLGLDDEDEDAELPGGDVVYWRLMGRKGLTGRYTDFEVDTLLALAGERAGGHIMFTTPPMIGEARRFASLLRFAQAGDDDGFDDEDGDDEDDDDHGPDAEDGVDDGELDFDGFDDDEPVDPR